MLYLPKERFSNAIKEKVDYRISEYFRGTISKSYVTHLPGKPLVKMQILLQTPEKVSNSIRRLEKQIANMINVWDDNFKEELQSQFTKQEASRRYKTFTNAFNTHYKSVFTGKQSIYDIVYLEKAIKSQHLEFDLYVDKYEDKSILHLKIFSPREKLEISSMLSTIENFGLFVLDIESFKVTPDLQNHKKYSIYIQHYKLKYSFDKKRSLLFLKENMKQALHSIIHGVIYDDIFNGLIVNAAITWREANCIRAYAKYLRQIKFTHGRRNIVKTLIAQDKITRELMRFFHIRFNPAQQREKEKEKSIERSLRKMIDEVSSIEEDEILNGYTNLILATKRTNFFQRGKDGKYKEYLSLKIASQEMPGIPLPVPFMEIFVFSSRFKGIHLRGSQVSRGGLRWSDRRDFRTEVLGLMKAQMTKNAVIIPQGCKGGFLLRKTDFTSKDDYWNEGVECYKTFLSAILDVTDNIERGKVVYPKEVVRQDGDDSYIVAAADKGTSTFSDHANDISNQYKFWLGDAFATGGSAGYDHKKLAITSRGAWICVEQHFTEIGRDISQEIFTAVGIGDMSGDVFGNGMLLSKKMKLVAAFNHMHIFLDPDPDPEVSHKERRRLFGLARSQWSDYSRSLLSKGGAIFSRNSKSVVIFRGGKKSFFYR